MLVLGTIEVAFALYARNVVLTSAHEAARAAIELGRTPEEARAVAIQSVERAAGGLVERLNVGIGITHSDPIVVEVRVHAMVEPLGPVPFRFPITADAVALRERVRG